MRACVWIVCICLLSVARPAFGVGEPVNGFPSWPERVILQWINRARVDPQIEMTACGANCSEKTCYSPKPPVSWNLALNRAARFHSDEIRLQSYFDHPSKCTVVSNINTLYPDLCDGAASCACVGGVKACMPTCTTTGQRIALFGGSFSGEIIASPADPNSAFYLWLFEPYASTACGFSIPNGHRWLILESGPSAGAGVSGVSTVDFGPGSALTKIPSGSHYPRQSTSVQAWANWYDPLGGAPSQAAINVGGTCLPLSLGRGTPANGAYQATVTSAGSGCHRYFFSFTDSNSNVIEYPTSGSLGIGPAASCADWDSSRPPSCAGGPTHTPTWSPLPISTPTISPTASQTATSTRSSTPSMTPSSTPTRTASATPSSTPTRTLTPTSTPTSTPSSTRTATPTRTPTSTPSSTRTRTATATWTPSSTPTSTRSGTITRTPTSTLPSTPTATLSPTRTPSSTVSATPSSTPTTSVTPTRTATSTPTSSASATPTSTPTATGSSTATPTVSPTQSASSTPTATRSGTVTRTPTSTPSGSVTRTQTASSTPTRTPTSSTPTPPAINLSQYAGRPGGRACVAAVLAAQGNAVGATRNDVGYDQSLLTWNSCTINPAIGSLSAANKQLTMSPQGLGVQRIDVGGSMPTAIADGSLYTCQLTIDANAPIGAISLANTASTFNTTGAPIAGTTGSAGAVVVTTCNGDCNGDGVVTVGELAACIGKYLGHPLCDANDWARGCPMADTDNDGRVSLSEVAACSNRYLRGC